MKKTLLLILTFMTISLSGFSQDITSQDIQKWKLAADQGNVDAQFNLGVCYANGTGVEKDYAQAVKYYRLAADQGDEDAKEKLERLYKEGKAVR